MRNKLAIPICVILLALVAEAQQFPPRREPLPDGQRITARDGDVIVVENDDRVRMVRRRQASLRVVVDNTRALVVILADWVPAAGQPDGVVDQTWRFTQVEGTWPLEPRWQGLAVVEAGEGMPGPPGPDGMLTLETPAGPVQFMRGLPWTSASSSAAAVIRYQGSSMGGSRLAFDDAERQQLSDNPPMGQFGVGSMSATTSATWSSAQASGAFLPPPLPPPPPPAPALVHGVAPVRVGGNVPVPRKIHNVQPVMPDTAIQANVRGVVILEITVAADGSVQDARVLRSIPLLDPAAIDAVRQWRFEPTLLNGQAVPIIMTVTVQFGG